MATSKPARDNAPADDARRRRRAESQQLFDTLAEDYRDDNDFSRRNMFGSSALRVNRKIFAFIGGEGELMIKVPHRSYLTPRDGEPPSRGDPLGEYSPM